MKHKCPLFDESVAVSVEETFAVDAMHSLCLGFCSQFVGHCMWWLMDKNALRSEAGTQAEIHIHTMEMRERRLLHWYDGQKGKQDAQQSK